MKDFIIIYNEITEQNYKIPNFDISGFETMVNGPYIHKFDDIITIFSKKKLTITIKYDHKNFLIALYIAYIRFKDPACKDNSISNNGIIIYNKDIEEFDFIKKMSKIENHYSFNIKLKTIEDLEYANTVLIYKEDPNYEDYYHFNIEFDR